MSVNDNNICWKGVFNTTRMLLNNAICSKSRFSCSLLKNIQVHIVTDIKVRTSQVTAKWRLDRTLTDTLCVHGAQPPAE